MANYKKSTYHSDIDLQRLSESFNDVEMILKQQTYSMIMFLEMFKELNEFQYSSAVIYKIMSKYPACGRQDLKIEEIMSKLSSCQEIIRRLSE